MAEQQPRWVQIAPYGVVALLAIGLSVYCRWALSDDAYIMMRVVRHALEGEGLHFNAGESGVQVCTSPLNLILTLTIAFASKLFGLGAEAAVPLAAQIVGGASMVLMSTGMMALSQRDRKLGLAPAAAAWALTSPLVMFTLGLETGLAFGLALWGLWALVQGRYRLAGLSLGLGFLARHDVGILLVLCAAWLWLSNSPATRKPTMLQFFGPGVVVALPWLLFSAVYFGTTVPTTLQAKLAQGGTVYWPAPYYMGTWRWIVDTLHAGVWLAAGVLVLALLGLWRDLSSRDKGSVARLLLLGYSAIHLLAYSALGLPEYHWYFVPYGLTLLVLASAGMSPQFPGKWTNLALACVIPPAVALAVSNSLPRSDPRLDLYRTVAAYLVQNPPSKAAGMKEIGIVGFYAPKMQIFDFSGIATPDQAARVAKSAAHSWLDEPDRADKVLIVGGHPLEPDIDPRFSALFEPEMAFDGGDAMPNGMQIWRRRL